MLDFVRGRYYTIGIARTPIAIREVTIARRRSLRLIAIRIDCELGWARRGLLAGYEFILGNASFRGPYLTGVIFVGEGTGY